MTDRNKVRKYGHDKVARDHEWGRYEVGYEVFP